VGGFGSIASLYPDEFNGQAFWNITAFISLALAFMNLLPIPALDGGHVMFLLYEIIFRRKPSRNVLIKSQVIGMVLLLLLFVYANMNDLFRFLQH
jgi:regulator of sigma E protease